MDHFYFLEQGIMINVDREHCYTLFPDQKQALTCFFEQWKFKSP
jgi:hypothetical protein